MMYNAAYYIDRRCTMNVWNKVFLGLIFISAIAVLVLGAVEFHVRNTGQKKIADMEKQIAETNDRINRVVAGADPLKLSLDKSLSDLSFEAFRAVVRERYTERGRAWFGCIVGRIEEQTLPPALEQISAQIILTGPILQGAAGAIPAVVPPDTLRGVVYVFEEAGVQLDGVQQDGEEPNTPSAGSFVGRFTVEGAPVPTKFRNDDEIEVDGWRVTLISADPIDDNEIEHIFDAAQSRWAVYMTPPIDRIAGIFTHLTEEQKQMIPEELRERFEPRPMPELNDEEKEEATAGEIALWERYRETFDDPESEYAHDFAAVLDWLYQHRNSMRRDISVTKSNIETYTEALEKASSENNKLETVDIPLEEKRVAAMIKQRDTVRELLKQYEEEIANLMLQMEKLQVLAKAFITGIAEALIQAAEKVEEQVRNAQR